MDKKENKQELDTQFGDEASLLVVDDEPDALTILERMFESDYRIFVASSAKEAMSILQQHHIDVVVSDQRMPNMSGVELLTWIYENYPDVVRILTTAHDDLEAAIGAINDGHVHQYITKPWDLDELRNIIRNEIARKRLIIANLALQKEVAQANVELREANDNLQSANQMLEMEIARSTYFSEYANIILDTVPQTLLTFDDQLNVVSINKFPAHFPVIDVKIVGNAIDHLPFFDSKVCDAIISSSKRVLDRRETIHLGEMTCQLLAGTERVWDISLFPITDPAGNKQVLMQIQDVTESHMLKIALIQSEKMAGVGTLAAGVAHEFNNLIGGMMGYAQLAKLTNSLDDYHKTVEIVFEASERAKKIIGDLLTFSRRPKDQVEMIKVADMIDQVLTLVERRFSKQQIKIFRILPEELAIETDIGQLQQAILQLIMSAQEAMPKGGELHIRSRMLEDKCIQIELDDSGEKLPEDKIESIFEPFSSLEGKSTFFEGRTKGLGLAVVYSLIHNLGATIQVRNNPDNGCTFSITLPRSATFDS